MLYLEYEFFKRKYKEAQRRLDGILNEKEVLFNRTQPKGMNTEQEKVNSSPQGNQFDSYLVAKEAKELDKRLEEAKSLMDDRAALLADKEKELRHSTHPYDMIYLCRYIDHLKIKNISRLINYSEPQIYRILKKIRYKIKHDSK